MSGNYDLNNWVKLGVLKHSACDSQLARSLSIKSPRISLELSGWMSIRFRWSAQKGTYLSNSLAIYMQLFANMLA